MSSSGKLKTPLGAWLGGLCQGNTSKRLMWGMGIGRYQPDVDLDPTLPWGTHVVPLVFAGGGMGMAWGGRGGPGWGDAVLLSHDNVSVEQNWW